MTAEDIKAKLLAEVMEGLDEDAVRSFKASALNAVKRIAATQAEIVVLTARLAKEREALKALEYQPFVVEI